LASLLSAAAESGWRSFAAELAGLSITAAFRSPRHLKKIFGSGFEMIRVSQSESPPVFRFMKKKAQIGDQIDDHNRGALQDHPEASRDGEFTVEKVPRSIRVRPR
jgi:hypothetical protein